MNSERVLVRKIVGRHKIESGSKVYLTREVDGKEPAVAGQRLVGRGQEITWVTKPTFTLVIDNSTPLYVASPSN